jgi:hypothetical protein
MVMGFVMLSFPLPFQLRLKPHFQEIIMRRVYIIFRFFGLLLFLCSLLFGCNRDNFTKTLPKEEAQKIFLQVVNRTPLFCESVSIKGVIYVIGVYEKPNDEVITGKDTVISTLSRVAGNWQEVTQSIAKNDAEGQELRKDFEFVTIDGAKYLYFSRQLIHQGSMYNGLGFIEFILYAPLEKQFAALDYSGEVREFDKDGMPLKIAGQFDNLVEFKNKPQLLKFLESKAEKCQLIYRLTAQDTDINNVKNFDKKWLRENPDAYATREDAWTSITFNEYSEKLFSATPVPDSNDEITENQHYIISTPFAGPVLGYDKVNKKYFVIWIPEGMGSGGGWGGRSFHAQFKTASMIVIKNFDTTIEIDLQRKQFRVLLHQEG